jgi:hypothetical protein
MAANFEIKHINGIPYYVSESTVYTFELDGGKPSPNSIAIGTYSNSGSNGDSIAYYPDWRERVAGNLQQFRQSLFTQERDKLRESIVKPTKQRKATRNPRKSSSRAKNPKSESC